MSQDKLKLKNACTHCFKSLGVPAKYEIYKFLKDNQGVSVNELVEVVGLKQPTVSHHLKDLQKNGLLKSKRKGKEVYYSVDTNCPVDSHRCILVGVSFEY